MLSLLLEILVAIWLLTTPAEAGDDPSASVCHLRGSYNLVCHTAGRMGGTVALGRMEFAPGFTCADHTARGSVDLMVDQRPGGEVHRRLTYGLTPDEYYPTIASARYITIYDEARRPLYESAAGPFVADIPLCEGASAPVPCQDSRGVVAATLLLVRASGPAETCTAVRVHAHVQSWP